MAYSSWGGEKWGNGSRTGYSSRCNTRLWPVAKCATFSRHPIPFGSRVRLSGHSRGYAFASRDSEEILAAVVKDNWHERNPRMGRGLEYARSGPVGLLTDWRLFSPEEIARDPFEQEFARRYDSMHYAGTFIPFAEDSFLVLSFERSQKRGEFWGAELDTVATGIEQARRSIAYALTTQQQTGNTSATKLPAHD